MTCLSNIQPFDIFFAEKRGDFENKYKHYYVCIYTQTNDINNPLKNDIYGLIITTNQKYKNIVNDYNVEIELNGKSCYVCCDKIVRIKLDHNVYPKHKHLKPEKIDQIKFNLSKFMNEIKRQTMLGEMK